ncbi:ISNCY family transposase [Patescibacteria group bacterium]|nr:ISNCY family transposase [Patescibacteria group bacterium]
MKWRLEMGDIVMSNEEINQVEIFEKLKRREIKQGKAAKVLGLSVRQIKRKLRKYKIDGAKSLVHKSRGRTSNNKISQKELDKAITLIRDKYWDFGPTLAHEKLDENHDFEISLSSVRKEMVRTGIWKPRKRKKVDSHQLRERRACFGELLQLDGSPHDWFEGRAPKCNLNVGVDDATNTFSIKFSKTETTQDYFKFLEEYINQYGLPLAIYCDKHSIFRVNTPSNLDLKKPSGNNKYEGLTQFGRACKQLDIELIFAHSAQAKGRVEKVNSTFQDRLVKEMRLEGISSIEEANKFVPGYMKKFNKMFSKKPRSSVDMHRKLNKIIDLSNILCVKETRTLSKNLTFQLDNIIFQIKTKRSAFTLRKTQVTILERHDGSIRILDYRDKLLEYETIKLLPSIKTTTAKQLNAKLDDILVKEAKKNYKKKNPWESSFEELTKDNYFYKPSGAV